MKYFAIVIFLFSILTNQVIGQVDTAQMKADIIEITPWVDRAPKDCMYTFLRGHFYYQVGEFKNAKKDLKKAVYLYDKYELPESTRMERSQTHYMLAVIYRKKKKLGLAKKHLQKSLVADSTKHEAYWFLGVIESLQKDTTESCRYFNKAVFYGDSSLSEKIPVWCK